jgi:hypothetical protein
MLRIDEAVVVLVDQEGSPVCFRWQENDYLIGSRPVRWFARTEWWAGERAHRGIGSGAVEVEMWRFIATGNGSMCPFELLHNTAADSWKLLRQF